MKVDSLEKALESELKDLYSAESQLTKALPKMAKAATSETLKQAFQTHLAETQNHIKRLEQIGESMSIRLTGKKCKAMEGLIEEGKELLDMDSDGALVDTLLIGAAQRIEHYEIAAYGTSKAIAKALGLDEVVSLLEETEQEEGKTDKLLTQISEDEVLPLAVGGAEDDEEDEDESEVEEEDEESPSRTSRSRSEKSATR